MCLLLVPIMLCFMSALSGAAKPEGTKSWTSFYIPIWLSPIYQNKRQTTKSIYPRSEVQTVTLNEVLRKLPQLPLLSSHISKQSLSVRKIKITLPRLNTQTQTHKQSTPSWNANLWLASLCSSVISQKPSHSGGQKTHSAPAPLCVKTKNYGMQMNSLMWGRIYSIIIDLRSFNAT